MRGVTCAAPIHIQGGKVEFASLKTLIIAAHGQRRPCRRSEVQCQCQECRRQLKTDDRLQYSFHRVYLVIECAFVPGLMEASEPASDPHLRAERPFYR